MDNDTGRLNSLAGHRALVTGAGLGIGQAIAIELARQGAAVAVHYAHSVEGAGATVSAIERNGGIAKAIQGNLATVDDCVRVVDDAVGWLCGLDILVNNAGVTRTAGILDTDVETYDALFNLNMRGYYFSSQRAIPHLQESTKASIINITSVHAAAGRPNNTAYAATKGAIVAFTRALAVELAGTGVRVNAIGPGVIEVPRYAEMPGYSRSVGDSVVPIGRVGNPQDIADTVAFLVSNAASFITGQILYVDGGTTSTMALHWPGDSMV